MRRDLLALLDVGEAADTPPGKEVRPPRSGRKARAPYEGRDRDHPLRVTVTPAERKTIEAKASAAGLSIASYLRAAALSRQVHSMLDLRAVGDLVKVAGDQGRLGGLLKLWLVDQPGKGAPEIEVRRLLDRLSDLQATLAEIVSRV
jgi:hypothetical protein